MFKYGFGRIFNILLILGTLIGILEPAFFSENIGLTQIVLSLFEPHWNQQFAMRWLLAIGFSASCYAFIIGMIFRNVPITIIWTNVDVRFTDVEGRRVELHREQLLRANQPGVTAYFSTHTPTSGGTVPHDQIQADIYCEACNLNDRVDVTGSEQGKTELVHLFGAALPYKWYVPLIPASFLNRDYNRLPKWIRKYVAVRTNVVVYANEYCGAKPVMNFSVVSGRYHHFNMSFQIHFNQRPIPDSLRIMRIQNNGVLDVHFERRPDNTVSIHLDRMQTETLRIVWLQDAVPALNVRAASTVPLAGPRS
jgi:hypothetical protein